MSIYLNADMALKMKDSPDVRKIVCETALSCYDDVSHLLKEYCVSTVDDLCKMATVEDLLSEEFDVTNTGDGFDASFYDNCSRSFSESISEMFTALLPYLGDESYLTMESPDDGGWFESYEAKEHQLITGDKHDFYTNDSGSPSDDDVANAIISAAKELTDKPETRNGLAERLSKAESLKDIVDTLSERTVV